jgi:hypothetical protein
MNKFNAFAHCPICKYWVNEDALNYDFDDDDKLIRICIYCMGEPWPVGQRFVYDPNHGNKQCPFCDTWNTPSASKCSECLELMR